MAVIAGELIYANVRLRLTANRTYGLVATRECPITSACAKYYDVGLSHNDLVNLLFSRYFHAPPIAHNAALRCERRLAIHERSETAKRCESLLNALLYSYSSVTPTTFSAGIILPSKVLSKSPMKQIQALRGAFLSAFLTLDFTGVLPALISWKIKVFLSVLGNSHRASKAALPTAVNLG